MSTHWTIYFNIVLYIYKRLHVLNIIVCRIKTIIRRVYEW